MPKCRIHFLTAAFLFLCLQWLPDRVYAQLSYQNEPALELFSDLREKTGYRFLYREALVSDIKLSFHTTEADWIPALKKALEMHQLTLKQGNKGKQLMIIPVSRSTASGKTVAVRIKGQVVDDASGDRLPFGTLFWEQNNRIHGTSTSRSGEFDIRLETDRDEITITGSYVGYRSETISLNLFDGRNIDDLTIRLQQQSVTGSEIVVMGSPHFSIRDSSLSGLVGTGRFSPLGEANAVRALQILPSVQPSTAMNDGLSIRGSAPDGFHLELDGIKIFNQSHLFGMLDSFNEDAIVNSGFYYGIAPADIHTPVGGKLSLTTKNGSLNQNKAGFRLSNTGLSTTAEGPVKRGESSWLISGRTSIMNYLNWLNNDRLIRWGLDVDRSHSGPRSDEIINATLVTPLQSDATFFDIHGKLYIEGRRGARTLLSTYFGGDRTRHNANRITKSRSLRDRFQETEVETRNRWNNFASTAQHHRSITSHLHSHTLLGISAYETGFSKDDFIYTNTIRNSQSIQTTVFTSPLANRSTMNRVKLAQRFDIDTGEVHLKAGFTGYYHRGEYLEESFDRQHFYIKTASLQTDLFLQMNWTMHNYLDISGGLRSHYFTNGKYLRFSPRVKLEFFNNLPVSLDAGYSRNFQFSNRISFRNAVTADMWILANSDQPPTSSEQVSAGIHTIPFSHLFLRVEAYLKQYNHLRMHELNAATLTDTFYDVPWFFQNRGQAKGIETILRFTSDYINVTQTYTHSLIELRNPLLHEGEPFVAPWDRTHSSATILELSLFKNLSLFASFTAASGSINFLPVQHPENQTRLPRYERLDVSALYTQKTEETGISAKVSLFNVFNRKNIWYKEFQPVIVSEGTVPAIRAELVDVYDLGFHPSFEVSISF